MSVHKHPLTANSPSDGDPTNTSNILKSFLEEIQRRFGGFKTNINKKVGYPNDALGLKQDAKQSFVIRQEFVRWMERQIEEEILEPLSPAQVREGKHWLAVYLKNSYVQGWDTTTGRLFQQGVGVDRLDRQEILSRPITKTELESIYLRAYQNLEDITSDMAQQIREITAEGYEKGWNPKKTARKMTGEITDIQNTRAEVLARTATIDAAADGTIANLKRAGVDTVSHVRWSAADDDRTCPFCDRLDGLKLTLEEVQRGTVRWAVQEGWKPQDWNLKPAAHPNCRCTLMPIPGADPPDTSLQERITNTFEGAQLV